MFWNPSIFLYYRAVKGLLLDTGKVETEREVKSTLSGVNLI
jgi:hypothetical protein